MLHSLRQQQCAAKSLKQGLMPGRLREAICHQSHFMEEDILGSVDLISSLYLAVLSDVAAGKVKLSM